MSDSILTLSVQKILDKVFTPNVKGYDPDEVDSFLDEVNKDYVSFDKYVNESREYIVSLETKLREANEVNKNLELENAKMRQKVDAIGDNKNADSTNIQLLDYISKLEKALWAQGIDPTAYK